MSRFDRKPTNAAEKPPSEAPAPAQLDPDHIDASNEGFKMLKSMGWTEGQGLGKQGAGDALPLSERIREEARREGLGRSKQEAEMLSKATTRKRDESDDEDAKRRRQEVGEEQRRRDEVLAEQHRNFYCACCDKQYTTVSEFSAHLCSHSVCMVCAHLYARVPWGDASAANDRKQMTHSGSATIDHTPMTQQSLKA